MARISLSNELKPYTGGETQFAFDVSSVRELFDVLGEQYPDLRPYLEVGIAVAIDGEIYQDALLQRIGGTSEVLLFTKIAGG